METTKSQTIINRPHCWGKMNWILKYEDGKEPYHSICHCEHGAMRCKELTRNQKTLVGESPNR